MQIDIDENREELFNNYYFENNSEKYESLSNKKISVLWKNYQKRNWIFYQEENNLFFIDFWIVNYFGITTIFYFPI